MRKVQAQTLEEAYRIACDALGCSMSELRYEVVQYPSKGLFGLFAKPAIIVAAREVNATKTMDVRSPSDEQTVTEAMTDKGTNSASPDRSVSSSSSDRGAVEENSSSASEGSHEAIIERFFDENGMNEADETLPDSARELSLQEEIETKLTALMQSSCFDIDVVEVDVIDDTAYIFMDGEDAALIIGKEGYRYNALSYLLFNWIHGRYKLFIKLEIAQFLSSQEEMIRHTLQPVIEHVQREGWGRTRPLDGILVQIALEQLREAFPNKYVAIKRQRDGSRYVLINEFNSRRR